jgi:hypothetical protein
MILFLEKLFVGGYLDLMFFLVRPNAISGLGVDFEKHCVRRLLVLSLCGTWSKIDVGYYGTHLCHWIWILFP